MKGEGTFTPEEGADPFVGKFGEDQVESEIKIEVLVESWLSKAVVSAAIAVHPYEEVAYFIAPLTNKDKYIGAGMIGELPHPVKWEDFLDARKISSSTLHILNILKPQRNGVKNRCLWWLRLIFT